MSESKNISRADRLYGEVKSAAVAYRLAPGSRINEVALAKRLGASRTPLREALNRLVAEGFLRFEQDRGFFCRELSARNIFELYQYRAVIELAAIRLACAQATDAEMSELADFLERTGPRSDGRDDQQLVALDEHFHCQVMALARNQEMSQALENINARIRFFRWMDMRTRRPRTQGEHRKIVAAMRERDANLAAERMQAHIERRLEEITDAVRHGRAHLAANPEDALL